MDQQPSSQLGLPQFDSSDDEGYQALLTFMRNLITGPLADEKSASRVPFNNEWVTLVDGLNTFFSMIPSYGEIMWNEKQDLLALVAMSLEVVRLIGIRVERVFIGNGDLGRRTFLKLLNLAFSLDHWVDAEMAGDADVLVPKALRHKVLPTILALTQSLDGHVINAANPGEAGWITLRNMLQDCLDTVEELLQLLPLSTFPCSVQLFSEPKISHGAIDASSGVILDNATEVPLMAVTILDVVVQTICLSLHCYAFLQQTYRRTTELTQRLFHYCRSPACSTTFSIRAQALTRILSIASKLCSRNGDMTNDAKSPLDNLPFLLLCFRIKEGSKSDWSPFEDEFRAALSGSGVVNYRQEDMNTIINLLLAQDWDQKDDNLLATIKAYITRCSLHLGPDSLSSIQNRITMTAESPVSALLKGILMDSRLKRDTKAVHSSDTPAWRTRIEASLRGLINPDEVNWMDVDGGLSDEEYILRALNAFKTRFERPLDDASPNNRLALTQQLIQLLCIFARCDPEGTHRRLPNIATLPFCQYFLARLLDGMPEDITDKVRGAVYEVYNTIMVHDAPVLTQTDLQHTLDVILRGLCDKNRSVRLAAGRALNRILQAYGPTHNLSISTVFGHLYRLSETHTVRETESLLITVGAIAKCSEPELLEHSVCFLISQLSRHNPLLKSLSYTQFLGVAKYLKKSTYSLVQPYMTMVAPFLVMRIVTQPTLLTETCRLISVNPTDFISTTLPRTLPQVFASSEAKVLEKICHEVQMDASSLFMKYAHDILAHIFLLPNNIATNQALAFVKDTVSRGRSNVTIPSIVVSCLVPLLSELVVSLGDENGGHLAVEALDKVDKTLSAPELRRKSSGSSGLLREYMLGIITSISQMLQELRGKQSVASKRRILRSFGILFTTIGPSISNVAPQIMATFQTMVTVPDLAEVTLNSWFQFVTTLRDSDVGPHAGPISAALISCWPTFSTSARDSAKRILHHIIHTMGHKLRKYLDDVVDLSSIEDLSEEYEKLKALRGSSTVEQRLKRILERSYNANVSVALQSLGELKRFMSEEHQDFIRELASGDMFDPLIGQILSTLFAAACRDSEGTEELHHLAYECMGILGAVDPDRCEIGPNDSRMIMMRNFADEEESMAFVLHLISDLLVGAYRSTSDIKYQGHLGYSIQELLKYCQFTPALVAATSNQSVPLKVRNRWKALPKHVLETVTPLLGGRFTLNLNATPELELPIYPGQSTYREWIQLWTVHLINNASGGTARKIFSVFRSAVRNKDVGVARFLLPHLVLNILISGEETDGEAIRSEILAVLQDQVQLNSPSSPDKKLLSAQAVFMLLDHLSKWVRVIRQELNTKKQENLTVKRPRIMPVSEDQLLRVDSILSSIDQNLMAKAALQCKAYARSLMNFEQLIRTLRERSPNHHDLPMYYERIHEIYAHLDEPDGMEGVSTLILSPSLEHQIRQHESMGQWTSAQSCWELRLQKEPDNLEFHLGLLRCHRNLGHYDTLRTHVKGVLTRNPDWQAALARFQVESAWMVSAWDEVQELVKSSPPQTPPIIMAQVLLAMRSGDHDELRNALASARAILGGPITASGVKGFRHAYDSLLDLHRTYELELISKVINVEDSSVSMIQRRQALKKLSRTLDSRLDTILPTFRTREPVLSMRRTAFSLRPELTQLTSTEIGRSWLASSKIARKAGQWQTAYSATLHARQIDNVYGFIESAKLLKATGAPLRALQELENSMLQLGMIESSTFADLTLDDEESKKLKAKADVLRARWMAESGRFEEGYVLKIFHNAVNAVLKWEGGNYHLGLYHDNCYKSLPQKDKVSRGVRMCQYTVKFFTKSLRFGSKHVYQTVPRLLTIWLDLGEDESIAKSELYKKMTEAVSKAIEELPLYKWYTAFPQIVSRVGHKNDDVAAILNSLIIAVLRAYMPQALWLFASIVNSQTTTRAEAGKRLLDRLRNDPRNAGTDVPRMINSCLSMMKELLRICQYAVRNEAKLSISRSFPALQNLGRCPLIIPLQQSLTASMPAPSASEVDHEPFPTNSPTFAEFFDEIEIMSSLAKPRKITLKGSDGNVYSFLAKPKDDLRKDARIMDFNTVVNKFLRGNSDSRRRQLHIRTYAAVPLNDECGLIQWVPNTMCFRPILLKAYSARGINPWGSDLTSVCNQIRDATPRDAAKLFREKLLTRFIPLFHEWFIETFPEPSAWLTARLTYSRTAAVMSMVGFMVGLGDRHTENILLDINTGDVVHCDFNCLFEKGKLLETPERVPFRLTQNMVDGLGVTGVEGVFRVACELTLQLLREHKDTLMSILDAFIHDPLVEWEDDRRKMERDRKNQVQASADLRTLAKGALEPMERRLKGFYSPKDHLNLRPNKEVSVSNLVQMLIQGATDPENLSKMYPGWSPWY